MSELKYITDIQLQDIGEMLLNELNINLLNTEPIIYKTYYVCVELVLAYYKRE